MHVSRLGATTCVRSRRLWASKVVKRRVAAACAFTDLEHNRWEAAVSPYDRVFGPLTAQAARHVAARALNAAGGASGRGLDLATGPGYVVEEAIRQGASASDITAVDFSAQMLVRARARLGTAEVQWLEADIQEPLPQDLHGQISWCTCNFGVLHLARPEDFFKVARATLRPGGVLVFTVWAELAKSPAFQIPLGAVQKYGNQDVGLPPGPPFFKYSDPAVAAQALEEAGFEPGSINSELLDMDWELEAPEDLWEVFLEGTARTGALLAKQTPAARENIEKAMLESLRTAQKARKQEAPPFVLSQPCLVVTAKAPSS